MGKIHLKIDVLKDQNDHGVYRCKMMQDYFFNHPRCDACTSRMPTTRANESQWIELRKVDQELLGIASHGKKVKSSEQKEKNYELHAKKKQKVLDDNDTFLANEKAKHSTTKYV
jgi:hypothetical protein